jgi:hypothetical protein
MHQWHPRETIGTSWKCRAGRQAAPGAVTVDRQPVTTASAVHVSYIGLAMIVGGGHPETGVRGQLRHWDGRADLVFAVCLKRVRDEKNQWTCEAKQCVQPNLVARKLYSLKVLKSFACRDGLGNYAAIHRLPTSARAARSPRLPLPRH